MDDMKTLTRIKASVEVGHRDFVTMSTSRLLKEMGVQGQAQHQAIKALIGAAENSN